MGVASGRAAAPVPSVPLILVTSKLGNVDMLSDSKRLWANVCQLTGRSKTTMGESHNAAITADSLNRHYAKISTDAEYIAPRFKCPASTPYVSEHITEWRVFNLLEAFHPTATGLNDLPAWFLKIGAPFFAAPIADTTSLSDSNFNSRMLYKNIGCI